MRGDGVCIGGLPGPEKAGRPVRISRTRSRLASGASLQAFLPGQGESLTPLVGTPSSCSHPLPSAPTFQ